MYISAESPKRSLRHYHGDEGTFLVVVGEHQETGHGEGAGATLRGTDRLRRTRTSRSDRLPTDGPRRTSCRSTACPTSVARCVPAVWVASGFKKWGLSNGVVAASIVTDGIIGRDNAWAEVFDVKRVGPLRSST
jgi:glycine/D-amino acid oxidase-like deaminating enzyme